MRTLKALGKFQRLPNPDPLSEGLIGYWKLDEGSGIYAYDSANGNTGTLQNSPSWISGISGNALELNGSTQFVSVARNAEFEPPTAITVCCWARIHSFSPASYPSLILKSNASDPNQGSSYCLAIGYMAPNPCFFVSTTSVWGSPIWTGTTLEYDRWYHIAGTYDGQKQRVYLDGVQIGIGDLTGAIRYDSMGLEFGVRGAWFIDGAIDCIRIYNRPLAQGDIERLYSGKS